MEVERFGEIFIKAGEQPQLLLPSSLMSSQCDGFFPRLPFLRFDHQFETAPIGQSDITHQDIEAQIAQQPQRILHIARRRDLVTAMNEKIRKNHATIFMVLDQQDIHTASIGATAAVACPAKTRGRGAKSESEEELQMGTILIIILILLLIGAWPAWPYSSGWGYFPTGGIGLVLLIVLILVLSGRF